jgi:hypothetical protein
LHLVVDDHLLHEAARVVGHAGIIFQDQLDLFASHPVAVLLEVEPCTGPGLPAGGIEAGTGHGEAHADLDHLLRGHPAWRTGEHRGGRQSNGDLSALHVISLPIGIGRSSARACRTLPRRP